MSTAQIVDHIVRTMATLTTNISTADYCAVLQGVIAEFQQRCDVAYQEAASSVGCDTSYTNDRALTMEARAS